MHIHARAHAEVWDRQATAHSDVAKAKGEAAYSESLQSGVSWPAPHSEPVEETGSAWFSEPVEETGPAPHSEPVEETGPAWFSEPVEETGPAWFSEPVEEPGPTRPAAEAESVDNAGVRSATIKARRIELKVGSANNEGVSVQRIKLSPNVPQIVISRSRAVQIGDNNRQMNRFDYKVVVSNR